MMDIMKKMNVSLAAKLTFQEYQHLYEIGEQDKTADLVMSLLLSAHSMNAKWTDDILAYMEANNVIDQARREELEHDPMSETLTSIVDSVKTVSSELTPHIPDAYARVKELFGDFADRSNIRGLLGQFLGNDKEKAQDDADEEAEPAKE